MAFNEPRRERADVLLTAPEPQYRASQEHTPRSFTPSAMTTTTLTDANVAAACVGTYVIPEDGECRGQMRQIVSFSSTTATVDKAWPSVTGCTRLRVWMPADVPVRTTTAGNTLHAISSPHASITNEPDSYYASKGYYLYAVGGANSGSATKITGFTSTTGAFTFQTALTSTTTNELFHVGKVLRPEGAITSTVRRAFLKRRIVGYTAADQGVPLNYEPASLTFDLAVRPLASSAGSSTAAVAPLEVGDMLADHMTQTLDTGSTASSMTGRTLTVSSGSGFTVGGFVLTTTGEAGFILAKSSNDLSFPTAHLTAASVGSGAVYAAAHYKLKTSDFRTRTFRYYRGRSTLEVMHGAMPKITLKVSRDDVGRLSFAYSSEEPGTYDVACPVAAGATNPFGILDTTVPRDSKGARFLLAGVRYLIDTFDFDFGLDPKPRRCLQGMNQADGMWMDVMPATVRFSAYAEENDTSSVVDLQDMSSAGTPVDLFLQIGTAATETFCLAIPAFQLQPASFEYRDGTGYFSCEGEAILPQAVRANSFGATLPPFAIGWL